MIAFLVGCAVPSGPDEAPEARAGEPAEAAPIEVAATVSIWLARGDGLEPVPRSVPEKFRFRATLQRLFQGPTPEEAANGFRLEASGATGMSNWRLADGVADVTLVGGCDGGGAALTVADHIRATLRQFPEVRHVRIRDPDGETSEPALPDSLPRCLLP